MHIHMHNRLHIHIHSTIAIDHLLILHQHGPECGDRTLMVGRPSRVIEYLEYLEYL